MYGLVLEGGGARGSYHMGVYKAILEEGIVIKGVAGTSIGALNGALIVQGDYELALKLWNQIAYSDIVQANEEEIDRLLNTKLNIEDLKHLSKKAFSLISDRGFDIEPFKEMIRENIDEKRIRDSAMDFGIVTVNLTDLVPLELFVEEIPEGSLADFLLASSYLPIFKFERLGGKIYLDGGFYDNLPFKLLQKKGYKKLILVRTHAKGLIRKPPKDDNMIIISPSRDIGKSYICDPQKANENIDMGYYDALKIFRDLKGDLYYIEGEEEEYYMEFLMKISESKIKKILEQLNLNLKANRRTLFEHIIPKIGSFLGLKEDFTYEELLVSLLERKAEQLQVKEYRIYRFKDLLKAVKSIGPFEEDDIEDSNSIGNLLNKVDLGKYFSKEESILEIGKIIFIDEAI
nr:patatin-like phospholipase family protein [Tissierella sp.]